MLIYPAIDIMGGRAVRLRKGDAQQKTDYGTPAEMGERWVTAGAAWIHIVDLDASFSGESRNGESVLQIRERVPHIKLQLGGGIRTMKDVETRLLKWNIDRVVLGTAAVQNPDLLAQAVREFGPGRVACGIDARNGLVLVSGWVRESGIAPIELGLKMKDIGVETVIYTDISKDGLLCGADIQGTRDLILNTGLNVIGSGGVAGISDLLTLKQIGCAGAIAGKALYENRFTLQEALQAVQSAEI